MRTLAWAALVVAVVAVAPSARAEDDIAAAREHYFRGTRLFDLRRFREAAKQYELAYEAKDDPKLLFNIGQAYRNAKDYEDAIGAFRSYLRRVPNAPHRAEVLERIREMQDVLATQTKAQDKPPEGTLPSNVDPSRPDASGGRPDESHATGANGKPKTLARDLAAPSSLDSAPTREAKPVRARLALGPGRLKQIAGLAVGVVGLGALGAGAYFAADVAAAMDEVNHAADENKRATLDRGRLSQTLQIALFTVGGAAVVSAVVLEVLGFREARVRRFAFQPLIGPTHVGVGVRF
jgi:tetratricopeptide (TPR) repeat protein